MPNFSSFQVVLTGLVDNDITTLKNSLEADKVVATYQSIGQSGNLADLSITAFNGTVTLRAVDSTDAAHRGSVLTLAGGVVPNPYTGWDEV